MLIRYSIIIQESEKVTHIFRENRDMRSSPAVQFLLVEPITDTLSGKED